MIQLQNITFRDFKDIKKLTSSQNVMKYIAEGNIWSVERVKKFIKYCQIENNQNDNKRTKYYYKIVNIDNEKSSKQSIHNTYTFIGIIGFHTFLQFKDYYLKVYIKEHQQGKGFYSKAVNLLLHKVAKHKPHINYILSLVYKDNEKMNSISKKKYEFINTLFLKNTELNKYKIEIPIVEYNNPIENIDQPQKKHTFLIKSIYLKMEDIKPLFLKRGNWTEFNTNDKGHPDFLYVDATYIPDQRLWKYKPFIKNLVNDDKYSIAYKHNLYTNMKKYKEVSKYILAQHNIDLYDHMKIDTLSKYEKLFNKDKIFIFKPVGEVQGIGIKIFDNYDDFFEHCVRIIQINSVRWNNIKLNNEKNKVITRREWILQEYIHNPLLYEEKKFHLRVYFLYYKKYDITLKKEVKKGYIMDLSQFYTALKNFKLEDFSNKDIHDSHIKSTSKAIYFQDDFRKEYGVKNTMHVTAQLKDVFKTVLKCIDAGCYTESKRCYELFGADIMITSDFDVKLIEINTRIAFSNFKNNTLNYNKIIMENILETVIDDIIPPQNAIPKLGNFIEV